MNRSESSAFRVQGTRRASPAAKLPTAYRFLLAACCLFLPCIAAAEDMSACRQRIESMNPAEKEQLLRYQERYAAMEPDEKKCLRRLHGQIEEQRPEDAARLRQVMRRYCDWVGTLPQFTQAELLEMPPDKRIARVKKIMEDQRRRQAVQLSPQDAKVLREWMKAYAARHLKNLSARDQRRMANLHPPERDRMIVVMMLKRLQTAHKRKIVPVDQQELDELRRRLSPAAAKLLEGKSLKEQWAVVAVWIRQVIRRRIVDRRHGGPMAEASNEQLALFFEKELTPELRDWLMSLPGDEMQRALRRLYTERKFPKRQGRILQPPGRMRPPGPPGPPWGRPHRLHRMDRPPLPHHPPPAPPSSPDEAKRKQSPGRD